MRKRIRLKQDIVIPAGTVLENYGPIKTEYAEPPFEHVIGFGRDVSGSFRLSDSDLETASEWFEEAA